VGSFRRAEMHSGFSTLRNTCGMSVGMRVKLNAVSPELKKDLERIAAIWTEGLTRFGGPFLAGKAFTAVDAFFCPVAFACSRTGSSCPRPPRTIKRLLALDAMKAW